MFVGTKHIFFRPLWAEDKRLLAMQELSEVGLRLSKIESESASIFGFTPAGVAQTGSTAAIATKSRVVLAA